MGKVALKITKEAKDNTFVDCDVHGGVEIEGSGTKMIRTKIRLFKKEHPFFFWLGVVASVLTIVGFIYQNF